MSCKNNPLADEVIGSNGVVIAPLNFLEKTLSKAMNNLTNYFGPATRTANKFLINTGLKKPSKEEIKQQVELAQENNYGFLKKREDYYLAAKGNDELAETMIQKQCDYLMAKINIIKSDPLTSPLTIAKTLHQLLILKDARPNGLPLHLVNTETSLLPYFNNDHDLAHRYWTELPKLLEKFNQDKRITPSQKKTVEIQIKSLECPSNEDYKRALSDYKDDSFEVARHAKSNLLEHIIPILSMKDGESDHTFPDRFYISMQMCAVRDSFRNDKKEWVEFLSNDPARIRKSFNEMPLLKRQKIMQVAKYLTKMQPLKMFYGQNAKKFLEVAEKTDAGREIATIIAEAS